MLVPVGKETLGTYSKGGKRAISLCTNVGFCLYELVGRVYLIRCWCQLESKSLGTDSKEKEYRFCFC